MRLNEYLKRRQEFYQRDRRFNIVYMTLFFAILIGNIFVADYIPESWNIAYLVAFFAFLLGNVWFSIKNGAWRVKNAGLDCKSCTTPLLGIPGDLAVTTGQCSHCGGSAFDS